MLWLILSIAAALAWSIGAFIDNYQTDVIFNKKLPESMKIINGISYLIAAAVFFFVVRPETIEIWQIVLLMLSGIFASLSSIPYFAGLKYEEATGAAIYYQLIPIIYLIAGWSIFNEPITPRQIIGFIVIIIAPILIIFSRKTIRSRRKEYASAFFFILYVILAATSGILSTRVGEDVSFTTVFFYFLLGRGLSDVTLFATHANWQKRIKYIWHHKRAPFLITVIITQIITIFAEASSRWSLILGVAALAAVVTNASELIITFVLGIILSAIWPKFGREKLTRHVVVAHLLAVILCVIGIIILQ